MWYVRAEEAARLFRFMEILRYIFAFIFNGLPEEMAVVTRIIKEKKKKKKTPTREN